MRAGLRPASVASGSGWRTVLLCHTVHAHRVVSQPSMSTQNADNRTKSTKLTHSDRQHPPGAQYFDAAAPPSVAFNVGGLHNVRAAIPIAQPKEDLRRSEHRDSAAGQVALRYARVATEESARGWNATTHMVIRIPLQLSAGASLPVTRVLHARVRAASTGCSLLQR